MIASMDERERELVAAYMTEAAALFSANQAGRTAAERVFGLLLTILAVAVAAGISAETPDVALPLPTLVFMLRSEQSRGKRSRGNVRSCLSAQGDSTGLP